MTTKSTELTVETVEVLIIRKRRRLAREWCSNCGRQVAVINMNDATTAGLNAEAIPHHVETGRLHLIESADGLSFICLNSLARE